MSGFEKHLTSLMTCDEFGNKPFMRGIKNHMALAPEMMALWNLVRSNKTLWAIPSVEEGLRKLEKKADELYGTNPTEGRRPLRRRHRSSYFVQKKAPYPEETT